MKDAHDHAKPGHAGPRSAAMKPWMEDWFGAIAVLCIALCIALVTLAWPAGPVFLAVVAAWLACRWIETVWTKAARNLLFPIMLGLGAFAFAQLACNIFPLWIAAARVWEIEHLMVESRAALHERIGWLDLPHMLVVLAVLLAATWWFPRLRLVTRFLGVAAAASALLTILTAATTFSLFAEQAVGDLALDLHAGDVSRYQAAVRPDIKSVGRYLAVAALDSGAASLDPIEAERLRYILERIKECHSAAGPLGNCSLAVARSVAKATAAEALREPAAVAFLAEIAAAAPPPDAPAPAPPEGVPSANGAPPADTLDGPAPVTRAGWQQERRAVSEREAEAAALRAQERKAAAETAFSSVLGALLPELGGIAGAYQDAVIDALSDPLGKIAEQLGARWQRSLAQSAPIVAAMIRSRAEAAKRLFVPARLAGKPQEPAFTPDLVAATEAAIKRAVADFEQLQNDIVHQGPRAGNPLLEERIKEEADDKLEGRK
jgi:signal transduction histidine kinase